jgi:hypothetical protein
VLFVFWVNRLESRCVVHALDLHKVPVLDRPSARTRMGFCRGCWGMTGYGLGRGTSLLLIRRLMIDRVLVVWWWCVMVGRLITG